VQIPSQIVSPGLGPNGPDARPSPIAQAPNYDGGHSSIQPGVVERQRGPRRCALCGSDADLSICKKAVKCMSKTYDSVVIGAGVFGAWTAWHLLRAGQRVLLIDKYGPANARASSGGQTRVIRMA